MPPSLFGGRLARSLDTYLGGTNLEVVKFGMYIMFPIGYMYYFGTNLDNRFGVPDFWPKPEQTNKIPFEREEIGEELARLREMRLRGRAERLRREGREDEAREVAAQVADVSRPAERFARIQGGWANFGTRIAGV